MSLLDKVHTFEEFFCRADAESIQSFVQCADGQSVWIDSRETLESGYETMVFPCDNDGNVENWQHIDRKLYNTYEEMQAGHTETVKKWQMQRRIAGLYT